MNIEPEIKSRCKRLLKEQEISRKEIRELISRAAFTMGNPTKCLEVYGWTLTGNRKRGYWSKTFDFPYFIRIVEIVEQRQKVFFRNKLIIYLNFYNVLSDTSTVILEMNMPSHSLFKYKDDSYYRRSGKEMFCAYNFHEPRVILKVSLMLLNFARELPKVLSSLKTKSIYDEAEESYGRTEIIEASEVIEKVRNAFKRAGNAVPNK